MMTTHGLIAFLQGEDRLFRWLYVSLKSFFLMSMMALAFSLLNHNQQIWQTLTDLGYPKYVMNILGVAFLVGVAILIQDRSRLLREWAYAGFALVFLGGFFSHLYAGSEGQLWPSVFYLLVLMTSYLMSKRLQWLHRGGRPSSQEEVL